MSNQPASKIKIYPAYRKTAIGLWFRRRVLGHLVMTGLELKRSLPTGSCDKSLIHNKKMYGVIVKKV